MMAWLANALLGATIIASAAVRASSTPAPSSLSFLLDMILTMALGPGHALHRQSQWTSMEHFIAAKVSVAMGLRLRQLVFSLRKGASVCCSNDLAREGQSHYWSWV